MSSTHRRRICSTSTMSSRKTRHWTPRVCRRSRCQLVTNTLPYLIGSPGHQGSKVTPTSVGRCCTSKWPPPGLTRLAGVSPNDATSRPPGSNWRLLGSQAFAHACQQERALRLASHAKVCPRCTRSPPEVQPHADHRTTRIHEDGALTEIRAEQIVRRQALLRGVIEHIEHVEEQLDASQAAEDAP